MDIVRSKLQPDTTHQVQMYDSAASRPLLRMRHQPAHMRGQLLSVGPWLLPTLQQHTRGRVLSTELEMSCSCETKCIAGIAVGSCAVRKSRAVSARHMNVLPDEH